jgi:hypothetical protein
LDVQGTASSSPGCYCDEHSGYPDGIGRRGDHAARGEATGPNVVFAFDKDANPHAIVLRSTQTGVAGSRVEVNVDSAKKPVFSHIFATEECKFGDGGSKCEVIVPASSRAFAGILSQFKRGRMARVSIQDAGVMKMDETVSLIGFMKALRSL